MRFLLDENLRASFAEVFTRRGHEVLAVANSEHRSRDDDLLIALCNREDRILVTLDVAMVEQPTALKTGAILLRPGGLYSPARLAEMLEEILTARGGVGACRQP